MEGKKDLVEHVVLLKKKSAKPIVRKCSFLEVAEFLSCFSWM